MTDFSLILCCYNEEENLEKTVELSVKTLTKLFRSFEIIIVEDKSQDASAKIARKLARRYGQVSIVENSINLGQGISFLIGLERSKGRLVMQNGADRPFDIRDLARALPFFPKYDIVIVSRKDRSAYSFWRKITSVANNFLRGLFFGFQYSDLNFVQIYKRKIFKSISVMARSAAFVTQELVLLAKQKGYKIHEIKLPYHRRVGGVAQHGKRRDILWASIDMINFWLEWRRPQGRQKGR